MAIPVTLVVDGGCTTQADNVPGSWAALLVAHKSDGTTVEKVLSGSAENTTNNRMELTAVIEGLRALKQIGVTVEVVCDSQLCPILIDTPQEVGGHRPRTPV